MFLFKYLRSDHGGIIFLKKNNFYHWSEILFFTYLPELDWIIRIMRYSNSWDRIVLFVFGIRSICDFRIIFEYPNSCHRIPNSSRIFYKQDMCRKHSKKSSCRYENKGSNFSHLIWSRNSHTKFLGGYYSILSIRYSNSWDWIVLFNIRYWWALLKKIIMRSKSH